MSDPFNDPIVERTFYTTQDPTTSAPNGGHLPAMTSVLYKICGRDPDKFNEATRLISLFIKEGIKNYKEAT